MRRGILLISLCVAVSLAILYVGYLRARGESTYIPTTDAITTAQANADRDALARRLSSQATDSTLAPAEGRRLVESATQLLQAYASDSDAAFAQILQRQGLQRGPAVGDDPVRQWQLDTSAIRGAIFDFDRATVRIICKDGRNEKLNAGATLDPLQVTYSQFLKSPRGETDIVDPFTARHTVVEVTVPGKLRSHDGKGSKGELVLYFAKRAPDGEWIIVGTSVQHLSMGKIYMSPPVQ